ncbi:tryptophan synthase beta subunit-like PLP-dependent enzyme [Delitschia confertaspora ATCC 74209]|uniref:L-serine ammonia-lyase n=1 Tax=Delitschia confertaspora ATCC 74209 TaxID=1513339 RepID=A0A9P4JJW2_9PLEO|nr:tryptophan synthase beta subunit-like PLP-dependent enzyme [Delitschia confertaspora ATCC 74209]
MTVKETLISSQEQQKPWIETPLKESYGLSKEAGCRVFLKLENLQPSGSFKSRGIGHYIQRRLTELPSSPAPHIFSSSGGNAGLAAVHASRTLNLPCTVVVPLSTKPHMIEKLKAAGAYEVVQQGPTWADADGYLRKEVMVKTPGPTIYVPPFDHPDIWTGNSTAIHETMTQLPPSCPHPTAIICSVGGGGLFNGVCEGILNNKVLSSASPTTVLALETQGADSLAKSLEKGELITLPGITSQATSLGATQVSKQTFDYASTYLSSNNTTSKLAVKSLVLTDAEAALGVLQLAEQERILAELACGVNVAMCFDGRLEKAMGRKLEESEVVVIVLCGGSNVGVGMVEKWKTEFGL